MVSRFDNKFVTSVFRKRTFTRLGTNFFSNVYPKYKISSILTLLFKAFKISSTYSLFHSEILILKSYFLQNNYPFKLFNGVVRKFLDSRYQADATMYTVLKQKLYLNLPYVGHLTDKIKRELLALLSRYFPQIQPIFYFCCNFTSGSFFR